jgi:luciferase family oxidoreductase group 1
MIDFALNALDQSAIVTDTNAAQAVRETVALAEYLDTLGYRRFWLAEHHNTSAFAGAAPEILIGHIAARTQNLSIGSGGIMLPHYAPLKVAEQFRMLASLSGGRIDLGLGRAPGGDPKTTAALQPGPKSWPPEVFPQQVEMLLQFLEDANGLKGEAGGFPEDHPYQGMHAQPLGPEAVPVFMLGSGGDGAYHAAQFGLPYVYAHFINLENLETALDAYRSHFKPSRQCPEPKVMLATSVLVAETTEEAAYLARPRNIWATQLMQNKGGRFPTLQEAHEWALTPQDAAILPQIEGRGFTGQTDDVLQRLSDTVQQYEIDEVFALTLIPDIDARKRSYKLLAEAAGLSQAGLAAAQ